MEWINDINEVGSMIISGIFVAVLMAALLLDIT